MPLPGCPVIDALKLVARVDSVWSLNDFITHKLLTPFKGLGVMEGGYLIKLQPDGRLYSLYSPRRIPILFINRVEDELTQMQKLGLISPFI